LVRELVKLLGGTVTLRSVHGNGSVFGVEVPVHLVDPALSGIDDSVAANEGADDQRVSTNEAIAVHAALSAPRILLAEDNPTNQAVAVASLRRLGLTAQVVDNGQAAVHEFEKEKFDLILMDCHMPIMDGVAATAAIRTIEHQRGAPSVPIIAITADMTSANVAQCKAVGVNELMAKPFSFAEFKQRVLHHLEKSTHVGLSGEFSTENRAPTADELAATIDESSLDDLRMLADDENPELLADIIDTYLVNAQLQLTELRQAMQVDDFVLVRQVSHSLKSSSAYVGATGLSSLLRALESAASSGEKVTVAELVPRALEVFEIVADRLQQYNSRGLSHVHPA
jgi:CheY-like chemotaxis protein